MRTSFRKLRGFALRHGDHKDRREYRPLTLFNELDKASQDMEDMRDCYDSLLSAAAATANSAYEFSESLREMGACLLEKTALNDDEESGRVLIMLGKVQFELQKLVDSYRSHIFQTITIPSESLLNELRNVEEMKRQCDEKRSVYEYMIMRQREKGRGRSGKADGLAMQQLQTAHDEYDEEATLFVFRLKSLKQGQSRSLLTQAARHHAAQLCFFKKALKSLESLEPHVKLVAEQQHIDYLFSELEDDDGDDDDDDDDEEDDDDNVDNDNDTHDGTDDGELSFDYGQIDQEQTVSTSRNSMELDMMDVTFPQVATVEAAKENQDKNVRRSFSFRGETRVGSQSAPLFAETKPDPAKRTTEMRPSYTRKFNTYVLPTPVDTKFSNSTVSGSLVPQTFNTSLSRRNLWHSSPLEPQKYEKLIGHEKFPLTTIKNAKSVLRESNKTTPSIRLPPPVAEGLSISRSDSKKIKRYAFSGPITSKAWPSQPFSAEPPGLYSGPLQKPRVQLVSSSPRVSPKLSPPASPTFLSSPKINELHELPRPPSKSVSKSTRPMNLVGHSAPLVHKGQMHHTGTTLVPKVASPLPVPSQAITRSFSIPSHSPRAMELNRPEETAQNLEMAEEMSSPPLTPISLSNIRPSLTVSENVNQTIQIRGAD
ncbi:hypothetical protein JCGZ_23122 [Jatropha curcas]|uniref:BAR domain-containing protein n=1 Tax=Jatropha curcas TaxID=180498 RepID=A0A067JUT4_JATCU|nr:uncharacterized protein At2g33490 [Jatropha curcas]KDP23289.1 hypothetical protein JCGZ_23122 [Jatropha curcas]